jgi:large subunit ribosomal protein L28
MAKCSVCGKKTTFGVNRPWSKKATNRQFKPNLQKVSVYEKGRKVKKVMCARCIRTMVKTSA